MEKAWQYAEESSRLFGNAKYGYVPGSISSTLEYAYTEWCMAELAKALGKTSGEQHYRKLAKSYQHIYDAEHRSFRPKDEKGNFLPWPEKGRLTEGYGSVESNPFQQGWFVPHDIEGLTQLMGGREKTIEELDYMLPIRRPTSFGISSIIMRMSRYIMFLSCTIGWDSLGKRSIGRALSARRLIRMR